MEVLNELKRKKMLQLIGASGEDPAKEESDMKYKKQICKKCGCEMEMEDDKEED